MSSTPPEHRQEPTGTGEDAELDAAEAEASGTTGSTPPDFPEGAGEGEGYAAAVDDQGVEGAGQDDSGGDYVSGSSAMTGTPEGSGTGYAAAVDGHGIDGAGDDASGSGYTDHEAAGSPGSEHQATGGPAHDDVLRLNESGDEGR